MFISSTGLLTLTEFEVMVSDYFLYTKGGFIIKENPFCVKICFSYLFIYHNMDKKGSEILKLQNMTYVTFELVIMCRWET